ncbi:hypothetical protein SRHO_G00178980 [Serrasalmus rhombeus]
MISAASDGMIGSNVTSSPRTAPPLPLVFLLMTAESRAPPPDDHSSSAEDYENLTGSGLDAPPPDDGSSSAEDYENITKLLCVQNIDQSGNELQLSTLSNANAAVTTSTQSTAELAEPCSTVKDLLQSSVELQGPSTLFLHFLTS